MVLEEDSLKTSNKHQRYAKTNHARLKPKLMLNVPHLKTRHVYTRKS